MLITADIGRNPGIYRIRNIVNDHCYVGSSANLQRRVLGHLSELRRGVHHAQPLQRAWNKYGADSFAFELIELCAEVDLYVREQYWLDTLKPAYNVKPVATPGWLGQKHSPETIEKMRAAQRTPEARERQKRMAAGRVGLKHSQESKAKMSAALKGRRLSEAAKEHLRKVAAEMQYRHSPEVRERISAANMGRKNSPDAIERMRLALTGRKRNPILIERTASKLRGRARSIEAASAAAEGLRAHYAERVAAGLPAREPLSARRRDAKLSSQQIAEMRAAWVPGRPGARRKKATPTIQQIAQNYGVSYLVAWRAIRGEQQCRS